MAAILIGAAVLKGYQLATEPVLGSGLLSSRVFLIAVVEFEWLFGVWLLAGMYPKWTWRVTVGCFGLFACVSLYKGLSGDASCGCFGRVTVSPWWTLTMDLAAVGALLLWTPREREPDGELARAEPARTLRFFRLGILLPVALFAGVSAAVAMASFRPAILAEDGMIVGPGDVVVLEPTKWVGKRFPLARHLAEGKRLQRGIWLVLFYRHGCPACTDAVSEYKQLAHDFSQRADYPSIAIIECPPYGGASRMDDNSHCVYGRLTSSKRWEISTPVVLLLDQGKVETVFDSARDIALLRAIWSG